MNNILGVDIGGSKIKMVLWDGRKILKEWRAEEATLENFKKGLDFFSVEKIGIGAPGILNFKTGELTRCGNLPKFKGLNLKKCFKAEIRVDNDAKCFLRGEMSAMTSKNTENVLGIIFGTGIGGAFVNEKLLNSKGITESEANGSWQMKNEKFKEEVIYKGRDGWAGEFGHMIIDKGKTWECLYQETKNKPEQQEKINAIGIANLINIFNPEMIILGGKGAKSPNKQLIEKYLLVSKQMPKFIKAKLKDNSVAIGAGMLWN